MHDGNQFRLELRSQLPFTSDVCCDKYGGGRVTGILLPLYVTAGPTNFSFPARGC
jgi:hypothetical protein